MVCHGGDRDKLRAIEGKPAETGDLLSRFIPFDLESFTYASDDPTKLRAPLKAMNELVAAAASAPTPAVTELVVNWYAAPVFKPNFDYTFTPAAWQTDNPTQTLYDEVIKFSCRSCHTTRTDGSGLAFNKAQQFVDEKTNIKLRVSNLDKPKQTATLQMPNAQRTFTIYWGRLDGNKPHQPTILNDYIKTH